MSDQQESSDLGAELAGDQAGAYPRRDEPAEVTFAGGIHLQAPGGGMG